MTNKYMNKIDFKQTISRLYIVLHVKRLFSFATILYEYILISIIDTQYKIFVEMSLWYSKSMLSCMIVFNIHIFPH